MSDVSQNDQSGNLHRQKNPKQNYLSFQFCILLLQFLVAKMKSHIHKRKIGEGNFRRHQRTRNFRLRVFDRIVSNYSPESFALLACFLERRISIAFFCQAMWFCETEIILVRFSSLCCHLFHRVYISLCVSHGVRRVHDQIFITRQRFNLQSWNFV